ncbi:MAG TPA: aldo/keto reductase [Candidatus Saccharimonadales bacterium]|nr:aldo/keto reductase [Candidatus Saccharimonadales bacterium]
MSVPTMHLNNGKSIPQVGLGLWRMKNRDECKAAVKTALDLGYTHFDTAQIYKNEAFLGEALKEAGATREDLFITTKIWNENQYWTDIDPSFEESLANLQTDYVDLLLLHFPVTELRRPAWRKMEAIYASGKAKAVGVSNYTVRHLEELLAESKLVPAVNQVEIHVFLQQPELIDFCHKHGIVVEAYSPLAHGEGMDDKVLATVAKKHGKSAAQIMLRWCIQQDTVVLPKSVHPDRIKENMEVFDFELDADDLQQLAGLEQDLRTCWDPTHVQ